MHDFEPFPGAPDPWARFICTSAGSPPSPAPNPLDHDLGSTSGSTHTYVDPAGPLPKGTLGASIRLNVIVAFSGVPSGALVADIGWQGGSGHELLQGGDLTTAGETPAPAVAEADVGGKTVVMTVRTVAPLLPAVVTGSLDLTAPAQSDLYGPSGSLQAADFLAGPPPATDLDIQFATGSGTPPATAADVVTAINAQLGGSVAVASLDSGGHLVLTSVGLGPGPQLILAAGTTDALALLGLSPGTFSGGTGSAPPFSSLTQSTSGSPSAGGVAELEVVVRQVARRRM